jgi:hypothetical protein
LIDFLATSFSSEITCLADSLTAVFSLDSVTTSEGFLLTSFLTDSCKS